MCVVDLEVGDIVKKAGDDRRLPGVDDAGRGYDNLRFIEFL